MKKRSDGKKTKPYKWIFGTLFLFLAGAILAAAYWANNTFGEVQFALILFHLERPLEGANMGPFIAAIPEVAFAAFAFMVAGFLLARECDTDRQLVLYVGKRRLAFSLDFWNRGYICYSLLALLFSAVVGLIYLGVPEYVWAQTHPSTLFEEYYVEPDEVVVTFPEKKRNLIYIFLESMENTYMSAEDGGLEYAEMIPELRDIQLANINFAADGGVNGAVPAYGTTWTAGAMVAHTAGIPLNLPIDSNSMEEKYHMLQGAKSIGEFLEEAGYTQEFLLGSDADFGGRKYYMQSHGNYTIRDYCYAQKKGWIPDDYFVWWGYEDQRLFEFARKELKKLYKKGEPFNLTMLTADTHFVGGYYCDLCQNDFEGDVYADTIACASRQVAEFVEWVQQQPFADDTTIVICGDHLTMDWYYIGRTLGWDPEDGVRKVYTAIINSAIDYELDYNRSYTTFDLYPTTLASLGCTIEGDRLALGTNLYSEESTLLEQLGIEALNEELMKYSKYYNQNILYKEAENE